ncbi:MAG: glycosyltransferase [Rhodospirillales bacterium]|nr:glycosyltransferase [Rhodospirillales bacterium]
MKVSLLVMTLNEIEGMKSIMPRIDRSWVDQILVVDGGSVDGTVDWARKQNYEVVEQTRKGLRWGYNEALPHIRGDYVITFSPDGNSIPDLLPQLTAKMAEGYDMVIVSRYLDNAISDDDDLVTAFGNWLFTKTINLLHGGCYTDAMVMYRGYRTKLFEELELTGDQGFSTPEKLFCTNIGTEPLLSVRAAKRNLKIGEIPGDEPARIGGSRKLQVIRWGSAYMFQVVRELFFWR